MKFVCLERLKEDDDCEGYVYSDFNLYMELEEEREEEEVRKYLTELLKKFKILKRSQTKEVCIFLTNTTKLKALQFSTKLKQKINKQKEEVISKPLPDTKKPERVIGLSRKDGVEKITVYDVDKRSKIHYITSVDLPSDAITRLKEITEDFYGLS